MGLDMYLTRRTYVKNWEHRDPEERHTVTYDGPLAYAIDASRVSELVEDVAYWRKSNQIHHWFVENCQEGVDDCRETLVTGDQLRGLYHLCTKLLANRDYDEAQEVLPSQSGFFFGSTDDEDWYWDDLEQTVEQLRPFLGAFEDENWNQSWHYRASW